MAYLLTEKASDLYHSQEYRINSGISEESELEGKLKPITVQDNLDKEQAQNIINNLPHLISLNKYIEE